MHLRSTESSFFSRLFSRVFACLSPRLVPSASSVTKFPIQSSRSLMKNISRPKTLPVKLFSTLNHYHLLLFFPVSYVSFSGSFTETVFPWFPYKNADALKIYITYFFLIQKVYYHLRTEIAMVSRILLLRNPCYLVNDCHLFVGFRCL